MQGLVPLSRAHHVDWSRVAVNIPCINMGVAVAQSTVDVQSLFSMPVGL